MLEFSLVPLGVGVSVSPYVAACTEVLEAHGLEHELHANGTNVAGEWDAVMAAIRTCHQRVHEMGAVRIQTLIKVGTRTDRHQTFQDKVSSALSKRRDKA